MDNAAARTCRSHSLLRSALIRKIKQKNLFIFNTHNLKKPLEHAVEILPPQRRAEMGEAKANLPNITANVREQPRLGLSSLT